MRVEPHSVGSIMHVVKRGARGMKIVCDDKDRFDFVRTAFLVNDIHQDNNWRTYVAKKPLFYRPKSWPKARPLVSILAWTLLDNHFHLLLKEKEEGGISKYMQRLGGSLSRAFNERHGGSGSIFQGSYKGRVVKSNRHLQYVHAYIIVKNVFDMYPGGLQKACVKFEKAWKFASEYKFSSFLTASQRYESPLVDFKTFQSIGLLRKDFKEYARSVLATHLETKEVPEEIKTLLLE